MHLRKGTATYYKYKYELLKEKVETLEASPYEPKELPSVFSYNKVKPKKSKNMRITSMTAKDIFVHFARIFLAIKDISDRLRKKKFATTTFANVSGIICV